MNYLKSIILFIFVLSTLVFQYLIILLKYQDIFMCFISKQIENPPIIYDYIIVGSGSAGSVITYRLGKDGKSKILLLEAGPYMGNLIDIPVITPFLHQSEVSWQYETVSQTTSCYGLKNNKSRWPMGKLTGGTARINNMIYARGHPHDFYSWYKDLPDFDYERDVLYYQKKAEQQEGSYRNDDYHSSSDGPLYVTDSIFTNIADYILEAVESLGYLIRDINGKENTGFMKPQVNMKNGQRFTTFHFLYKNKGSNIKIQTNSYVTKVLFKSNYEAYAVIYKHLGKYYKVQARKGIILSAGVVGSPKILMLSGIGNKSYLHNLNIECINDLPVGDNLQDHVTTGIDFIRVKSNLNFKITDILFPWSAYDYYMKSNGPWTATGCDVVGVLNVSENYPDIGFMVLPTGITADNGLFLRENLGINDATWNSYFSHANNTITVLPVVLHPKSRGTVRLLDKNPFSQPLIDPKYLSDIDDVKILVKGIEIIKKILKTKAMISIEASINNNKISGCENYIFDTNEYWECFVKHLTITAFHPVGTCKMGSSQDKSSVVGFDFKVLNSNKLYVADASVFPNLTSANINSVVVMIAEKAADAIKYHSYLQENKSYKIDIFIQRHYC